VPLHAALYALVQGKEASWVSGASESTTVGGTR
jgi:hypothetical protein